MRKIIHVDMDAFYAAVEMRDRPSLHHVPMAVGGSKERRGVLCTANYEARKYGVKGAMSTAQALRLCPHLIVIKPNIKKYAEVSKEVFQIFYQFTPLVESVSLDEAYLDVTDSKEYQNSATLIAHEIRKRIKTQTQLTASAGIAPNKLIAKLASEHRKPNGQFTVAPHEVAEFIKSVSVEKIWGIGKVTSQKLHGLGFKTCQDLQTQSRAELIHYLGKFGDALYDFSRGNDERQVETDYERKSLGNEETFSQDISDLNEMKSIMVRLVQELTDSLSKHQDQIIKNIQVKIKYHDFKLTSIERSLPLEEKHFTNLLEERWLQDPRPIRLLGVGVKFEESRPIPGQMQLLTEQNL